MRRGSAAWTLAALLVCPIGARAEPSPPSDPDQALAKQYFVLGKTYYDQGSYERALDAFKDSFKHSANAKPSQRAALLYNIAKCYESLGELAPAIEHYEQCLAQSEQQNPTIKARIANLRARLERARKRTARPALAPAQPPTPPAPAPPRTPTNVAPQPRPPALQPLLGRGPAPGPRPRRAKPIPPPAAPSTPRAPADEGGSSWMTWTGWGLVGAGVASLVTSFVFAARAASKSQLMEDALACSTGEGSADCPDPPGTAYEWSTVKREIEDPGKRFERIQIATLVVGLVAGSAGAALLLFAPRARARSSERASVAPLIDSHGVGVAGQFTF